MTAEVSRSRFVAGAECTYCHVVDRMMVDLDDEGRLLARRCLACGKEEKMLAVTASGTPGPEPVNVIKTRQVE